MWFGSLHFVDRTLCVNSERRVFSRMSFPLFVTADLAVSSLVIRWKLYISSVFYSRHIALVIYCGYCGCRHTALGGIALNLWSQISKKRFVLWILTDILNTFPFNYWIVEVRAPVLWRCTVLVDVIDYLLIAIRHYTVASLSVIFVGKFCKNCRSSLISNCWVCFTILLMLSDTVLAMRIGLFTTRWPQRCRSKFITLN